MSENQPESEQHALFVSSEQMAGATNYNRWTYKLFERLIRGRVLEVGCGVGSFTEMLLESQLADSITSIDVSKDSIDYCKERFDGQPITFACMPLEEVSGRFDTILCMNVVEHIENDRAAIAHLLALLEPEGTLFLLVPSHPVLYNDFDRAAGHYRRYSKSAMRRILDSVAVETDPLAVEQHYFNCVGALGYYLVYRVLGRQGEDSAGTEIGFFDRVVVPLMSRIEGKWVPFGLSLICVVTKQGVRDQ